MLCDIQQNYSWMYTNYLYLHMQSSASFICEHKDTFGWFIFSNSLLETLAYILVSMLRWIQWFTRMFYCSMMEIFSLYNIGITHISSLVKESSIALCIVSYFFLTMLTPFFPAGCLLIFFVFFFLCLYLIM